MRNRRRGKRPTSFSRTVEAASDRLRPSPDIDWATVDVVVGTREDVTRTGINRPCARCTQPVFTSRRYPIAVALVCEYCALDLAGDDRTRASADGDALPFASGGDWTADPWRRGTGRVAPKRGPRKLGQPPRTETGEEKEPEPE